MGAGLAGAVVLTAAPAQAALHESNYGFQASSFGTRVLASDANLRSDRTAWAVLGCTRLTGKYGKVSQASLDSSQTGNPLINVGVVRSTKKTYSHKKKGVRAGVLGTNYIEQVVIGDSGLGTPVLTIDGLRSAARSWVDTNGKFHAKTHLSLASMSLTGVDTTGAPQSLLDLLDAVGSGVLGNVVDILAAYPAGIEIPGLGRIYLPGSGTSFRREVVKANTAQASVKALRIVLYGTDGIEGTADDSEVTIGRAWSRISTAPAGILHGHAYGVSSQVAGGLAGIGKVAFQLLPCQGTRGHVKKATTTGLNVLGLGYVTTGNVAGYSYGVQRRDGRVVAWTKGEVANVTLTDGGSNTLTISALTGRVHLKQFRNGKLKTASSSLQARGVKFGDITGTSVTGVSLNGVDQGSFGPGDSLDIPGLATIVFGEVTPLKRGLQVIAAHIYLLSGPAADAGLVDVKLGLAKARITKY